MRTFLSNDDRALVLYILEEIWPLFYEGSSTRDWDRVAPQILKKLNEKRWLELMDRFRLLKTTEDE